MTRADGGRRALQIVVAGLSAVPILAGAGGLLLGPRFVAVLSEVGISLDSHFRYLSGLLLALGLTFLSTVPDIERKTQRFRLASAVVVTGGLGRLLSLLLVGPPTMPHLAALGIELVVVPLLVVWQDRIARAAASAV